MPQRFLAGGALAPFDPLALLDQRAAFCSGMVRGGASKRDPGLRCCALRRSWSWQRWGRQSQGNSDARSVAATTGLCCSSSRRRSVTEAWGRL